MPTVYNFERWLTQVEVAADGATARGTLPLNRPSFLSRCLVSCELIGLFWSSCVAGVAGSEVVTDLFVPEMGTSYEGMHGPSSPPPRI
jgi:hypothetical protein